MLIGPQLGPQHRDRVPSHNHTPTWASLQKSRPTSHDAGSDHVLRWTTPQSCPGLPSANGTSVPSHWCLRCGVHFPTLPPARSLLRALGRDVWQARGGGWEVNVVGGS